MQYISTDSFYQCQAHGYEENETRQLNKDLVPSTIGPGCTSIGLVTNILKYYK